VPTITEYEMKRRKMPSQRVSKPRGGKRGSEPRTQILTRAEQVVALHEQGRTQDEIARELDISQAAASKILHRVDVRALQLLAEHRAADKMRRVRMLQYVSRESRAAWEASKREGRVRKRQRKVASASGAPVTMHEVVVDEHPDPRILDQARKAEEAIAEICGLADPNRPDGTPDDGRAQRRQTAGPSTGSGPSTTSDVTARGLRDLTLDEQRARVEHLVQLLNSIRMEKPQ